MTPTIFGSTVGYPSDSLASCYLGHVKKFSCNVMNVVNVYWIVCCWLV